MRRHSLILLAAATIGLAASQALAADFPRKSPSYAPHHRHRRLGPDATSAPTSAARLATRVQAVHGNRLYRR